MNLFILHPTLPAYRKAFFEKLNYQLEKKNIKLTVVHGSSFFKKSIKPDATPAYSTIPLETIEYSPFGYRIVRWKGMFKALRTVRPEMVIILFSPGNITFWLVQIYCYLNKVKIGLWSNGSVRNEIVGIRRKFRGVFLNFFTRRATFHICYGTRYEKELLASGYDRSRIFVAQNTIDVEKIMAENARKCEKPADVYSFLFVGALVEGKNLDLAIKAIARLIREGYKVKFKIVGSGELIDDLKSLVKEEQMDENISVHGYITDEKIPDFFNEADVFLLPGTGGLAINEAMAYGLPLISTIADGTIIDLLSEGDNGYFLNDIPDFDNIYELCKKILHKSKEELLKMGEVSRKIITEKASLSNMVNGFEKAVLYAV
jgi:glycosyltransferase involved in cell wall biosynthesis